MELYEIPFTLSRNYEKKCTGKFIHCAFRKDYSLRKAITGSFFDAIRAGINPAINVRSILIRIKIMAPWVGRMATLERSVRDRIIAFMGKRSKMVVPMPKRPAAKPMVSVSALNTLEMSLLEAPMERSTPISLVLSKTEI
jgi:hypothetical protein